VPEGKTLRQVIAQVIVLSCIRKVDTLAMTEVAAMSKTSLAVSRKAKTNRSPLSYLFSRGGVVLVQKDAYLRQLQALDAEKNWKAHANLLYPGLAHLAVAPYSDVVDMFRSALKVSQAGRKLHGLESMFLSCLQTIQLHGHRELALTGIFAWDRYQHLKTDRKALIIVDRSTNGLLYISAKATATAYSAVKPAALLQQTVAQVLKKLAGMRDIEASLGGYHDPAEEVMDCTAKFVGWYSTALVIVAAVAGGLAAGFNKGDGTDKLNSGLGYGANVLQIGGAIGAAITGMILAYGCPSEDASKTDSQNVNTNVQNLSAAAAGSSQVGSIDQIDEIVNETNQLIQNIMDQTDAHLQSQFGGTLSSTGATLSNYSGMSGDDPFGIWANGTNSATPPPTPESTEPNQGDNQDMTNQQGTPPSTEQQETQPASQPGGPAPEPGSGLPSDDGGEGHSYPPGLHWPTPNDLPNPDDSGPGNPVAFPNGAVFVPASTLTILSRMAAKSVSGSILNVAKEATTSIKVSVESVAT
jgi:hypothetical protein